MSADAVTRPQPAGSDRPVTVVDVHAHLMPDAAFGRLPGSSTPSWNADRSAVSIIVDGPSGGTSRAAPAALRHLDVHRSSQRSRGIDVSVLGPWIDMVKAFSVPEDQQRWCRVVSEELASVTAGAAHSAWLAALPDTDGGRAAEELEWSAAHGAVGAMIAANPTGATLGRPDFESLWITAERCDLPIVLHPGYFHQPPLLAENFLFNVVGFPAETTAAVAAIAAAGVPDRHPALRLVLVHGGGFFPYQYARINEGFLRRSMVSADTKLLPRDLLRWFFYDTVLFAEPPLAYLVELVGHERVMAGSDCPFSMTDDGPFAAGVIDAWEPHVRRAILGGTAAGVFRLEGGA